MTAVEITCKPGDGILAVSHDTVAALDTIAVQLTGHLEQLADTIPAGTPWQLDLAIGRTVTDTVHLTARPATDHDNESEEDAP